MTALTPLKSNRLAVNFLFAINGFLFASYISRLPRIQSQFELDNGETGIMLLISAVGALIAMPFTGWLITGNGSRKVSSVSALLICSFVPLLGFSPNAIILGIVFFLIGIASGTLDVAMNAQAVAVERKMGKPIMSSFHGIFSAGMMAGAGAGALFTKLGYGLIAHLTAIALICLLFAVWSILHLIKDKGDKSQRGSAFKLPDPALLGIGFIAFCCMTSEGAMSDWSTNYMLEIAGASESLAPIGLAAFSFAMMTARFLGDRFRRSLGDAKLLFICSLIAITGLLIVILLPSPATVILGLVAVGLGLSVIVPIAYSRAGNYPGLDAGVGIGMVTTIGYSGFLFGPPIIGFLADWQDLRFAMLFVLLLLVIMVGLSRKQSI